MNSVVVAVGYLKTMVWSMVSAFAAAHIQPVAVAGVVVSLRRNWTIATCSRKGEGAE
jgi:hypothetical protein